MRNGITRVESGAACVQRIRNEGGPGTNRALEEILGKGAQKPVRKTCIESPDKLTRDKRVLCEFALLARASVVDDSLSVRRHMLRVGAIFASTSTMSAEQTNTKATKLMDAVSKGTFDNLDEREKSVAVALRVILGGNVESSDVLGVLPGLMRSMCALDSKCRESWLPSLVQGAEILEGMHNNDLMSVAHWFLGLATSHIDRPVSTFLTKLDVDELAEAKIDQVDTASKAATLRTAMGTTEDENTKTAAGNAAAYRRFLLGLGGYALEASRNGLPSDAARQAFRSAAVEALQTLGSGRGFRRSFVQNLITPQLALRAGVSPAYSGVRSAASIDLLAARFPLFYTNRLYVGGSASLADLLGPLSEMASRDEKVKFENEMLLLSLFFALRLEVNVGFPSLSEHLALSAGATMRLAAASEASENVARYEWIGEVEAGRCFEYGLSVKYLF